MKLTSELIEGLNIALNESRLVGVDVDPGCPIAKVDLKVLSLPEEGPADSDHEIILRLFPIARVAAALVDETGRVKGFGIEDLSDVVRKFGGQPIYGWNFVDSDTSELYELLGQLSLDHRTGGAGHTHTLHLFQESQTAKLDLCIWFDEIDLEDENGRGIDLVAFIADGKRWWDGVFSGDPRTKGSGIEPLK